jgi:hypothetical protein
MLLDDEDESVVTALFQVQDKVIQIRQRPHEGRVCDKELENAQEKVRIQFGMHQATSSGLSTQATSLTRPLPCISRSSCPCTGSDPANNMQVLCSIS